MAQAEVITRGTENSSDDTFEAILRVVPSLCIVIAVLALLPPLLEMSQRLQAQSYSGVLDPRVLSANQNEQKLDLVNNKPYTPWISAYVIQDGPDPVKVAINDPGERFTVNPGETVTVNRSGAQKRISVIYYVCEVGKRASLRIWGEY